MPSSSSSSSSSSLNNKKYDVFISFRGADVRKGFLSHLHKALLDQNIEAFIDQHLERGKEISESLQKKIEESHIAIVIFSPHYADSEWCLQELLKIAECRNSTGQTVIPVFYGVDPSHVQDLTRSYGNALAQHRTKFGESVVESWGNVLKETASLSGLVSSNFKTESDLIEEIIKQALEKLDSLYPSDSASDFGLVGINSRVKKVMSLLCGSEDVSVVGIWGEGGIGKTTLAQATFDRIRSRFDSQCFVRNVKEISDKFTTDAVRNEVDSKLFGTSFTNMTRKRLSRKRVILVLDDVSDLDQIKSIMRYKDDFGCGSRIIITSRDRHLLKNLGAKIYSVEKLDHNEALQLFCLNAFSNKIPEDGYSELSERAVKYAQGLPLALQVLGSSLFQRSADEWEDEFEKLKSTSDQKIHKILRISFDGLCDVEKEIFLDIACYFKGRQRDEVESLLDVGGSKIGISRLAEKALISISPLNQINMHDLIQQMAKNIICEEKTPGKRRWLWDPEEIYRLLTKETGTDAVKGISLDISKTKKINLSPTAFRKLYNLRYLSFYTSESGNAQLCVPEGLDYLPEQLRYLYWVQYPSRSLPSISFCAEKLIRLTICGSQLEELWDGVQNFPNLKRIFLSRNTKLIKVPDLSGASNLESLYLMNCSSLESLPESICDLQNLSFLNVSFCVKLNRLPQNFGCLKSLVFLLARESGIKEVPYSINNMRELVKLDLSGCRGLKLPPLTGDFPHLVNIDLTNCSMTEFPVDLCSVTSLMYLCVGRNNFESIPESIQNLLELRILDLNNCKKLKHLPESIKLLPRLNHLFMSGCTSLDSDRCSRTVNHAVLASIENTRMITPNTSVWQPGSEAPGKMKYENEHGSSVSFSFKLLQHLRNPEFYARVVYDRPQCGISFKEKFFDESGLCFYTHGINENSYVVRSNDGSQHVVFGQLRIFDGNFVKGHKYTANIQFQTTDRGGKIMKCGVTPLFDHETIE